MSGRYLRWLGAGAVIAIVGAASLAVAADYAGYPAVRVLLGGAPLASDVPAIVVEGRTLLPVRALAEALGLQVTWDAATSTVSLASADPAAADRRRQLAAAQAGLADLEAQHQTALAESAALQADIARVQGQAAAAGEAQARLQAQVRALAQRLREVAAATAQLPAAGPVAYPRRDALKSAALAADAAGTRVLSSLPALESRLVYFVRTWELGGAATESLVLRDPRGTVLDGQSRRLAASGRYSDPLALDLAIPGAYTLEVSLDGEPAARITLVVSDDSGSLFTEHARVIPGDSGVTRAMLQAVADGVEQAAYPINAAEFGLPLGRVENIKVYSSPAGYFEGLMADGESQSSAATLVRSSAGLSTPQAISIPYYRHPSALELRDTLTHELFHVMARRLGLDYRLPSWANEGIAWYVGLKARAQASTPVYGEGYTGLIRSDTAGAARRGSLLPLFSRNADLFRNLDADYNVEWQDYLAVEYLRSLVPDGINRYLQRLLVEDADTALQTVFGLTQAELDTRVQQMLLAIAARPDRGVRLTLQVPAAFDGSVYVVPRESSRGMALVGGGTHTITAAAGGGLSSDRGLGATKDLSFTTGSQVEVGVYPTLPVRWGTRNVRSGWLVISFEHGVWYYARATLYFTDGGSITVTPGAEVLGVRLLAVTPL